MLAMAENRRSRSLCAQIAVAYGELLAGRRRSRGPTNGIAAAWLSVTTLTEWPEPFFCFFVLPVSGVVPFCEGGCPVFYGTPTLTEWPEPFFCFFVSPVSGVVPFCEGGRPVFYGT